MSSETDIAFLRIMGPAYIKRARRFVRWSKCRRAGVSAFWIVTAPIWFVLAMVAAPFVVALLGYDALTDWVHNDELHEQMAMRQIAAWDTAEAAATHAAKESRSDDRPAPGQGGGRG